MKDNISIDIALIPDDRMLELVVGFNRKLIAKHEPRIVLDVKHRLPHITLGMFCVGRNSLSAIFSFMRQVALMTPGFELAATQVHTHGEFPTPDLTIGRTSELQALHEKVVGELAQYATNPVTLETLHQNPPPHPRSLRWIDGYFTKSSRENFYPHITIGYGRLDEIPRFPIHFQAKRLVAFHLGDYCTCGQVLAEERLSVDA